MTLKEAKKILKKEGFILSLASKVINQTGAIREFEKPEVCEAIKVANANKWTIGLSPIEWNEREKRLKKEHEKNNKESAHDKKSMTLEEAKDMLMKEGFKLEGPGKPCDVSECFIELESPEICEAMQIVCSAGYMIMMEVCDFNARKARLKEQLEEHSNAPTSGSPALKEAASQFNDALLDEQAKKIGEQNKEITRLLSLVEKKENSISRLYYEKSVLEKENEDLKKGELPARYFDKALVDEQAEKIKKLEHEKLDILEMPSSCKQTIAEQRKKIKRLNKIIHKKNEDIRLSKIREKNLAELGLKYVGENEKLKKKLADKIVDEIDARALKSAESALAYKEKVIAEKDEVIADLGKELAEAKKLNTAKILDINAKCMRAARESINDVFESYAAKYAKSTLDELKDKAYESFNAKAHKLGLVGSNDGKGLLNQMAGVDAAEEGADQSGKIVICGKDFGKLLKENEESAEELSKVLNDVIDQFLLFGEIIIKE